MHTELMNMFWNWISIGLLGSCHCCCLGLLSEVNLTSVSGPSAIHVCFSVYHVMCAWCRTPLHFLNHHWHKGLIIAGD